MSYFTKNINRVIFILSILALFGFLFCASSKQVEGALIVERKLVETGDDFFGDYYTGSEKQNASYRKTAKKKFKKSYTNKANIDMNDSYFTGSGESTFNELLFRVSFILLFLFGLMLFVKMYFKAGNINRSIGGMRGNIFQKLKNKISDFENIKVKHSIFLAPGQNVYLVEIDGKKLLLGGTPQGGVNFLTELSGIQSDELSEQAPSFITPVRINAIHPEIIEKPFSPPTGINENNDIAEQYNNIFKEPVKNKNNITESPVVKKARLELLNTAKQSSTQESIKPKSPQSFKRRVRFSQTLLTNTSIK